MKPPIIAALMAVINSTDVTDSGIYYRGKISHFMMSHRSSLYAEAKRENPDLRPPISQAEILDSSESPASSRNP